MSLRTPRFKNEFLALQNIKIDQEQNLLIKSDLSNIIDKAIVNFLENKNQSNYTFGILDFTGSDFEAAVKGSEPVVFESDVGRQGVDRQSTINPYVKTAYNIKYFLDNLDLDNSEDKEFFVNLVKNSLTFSPSIPYLDRKKALELFRVPAISHITNYINLGLSDYYIEKGDLTRGTTIGEQFRFINKMLIDNAYNPNYNIFVGTQKVQYVNLKEFSKDKFFKFTFLYLARLYNLVLNKKTNVNLCLVLVGLRAILDINSYRSFHVTEQGAADRLYKIKALLVELLERGKEYNLNFILCDVNTEDYDFLTNFCFAIESEIGGLILDY